MNVELELRYCDSPQRPAAAWLVLGDGPQAWLAEMAAWQVPLVAAKLFPVPQAGDSDRLAGVIVVLLAGSAEPAVVRAIAYGRLAEQLLAPVEAALAPPLALSELATLFPAGEATFVWHPGAGLLRFAPSSELRVADLVAPPQEVAARWDAAEPGIAQCDRILSIEPLSPLTLGDVLAAGRGDIGSQPLRGSKLPAGANEPAGGAVGAILAAAGMSAAAMGAKAVSAAAGAGNLLSGMLSASGVGGGFVGQGSPGRQPTRSRPPGSSWFERLAQWAKARQEAARKNLDRLRNRQVERLLNLLQNSPDDGLRFALPIGGQGDHRGLAPPSAQLGERRVDFNLSNLGGGGPVDAWDLPPELRERLRQSYRDLAHREIALGRHRRAAYIFAELLGDLAAAAATLADGGHFREAAVLYKQRLNQTLMAAQCLERGGLWAEAIALYEELGHWETVGDLYRRLDREDQARTAYRRVVDQRLSAGDYLAAAKLIEEKLTDPEEAYQVLLGGWTAAPQQKILDASFALLARRGQHDRAGELVAALRMPEMPGTRAVTAVPALAQAATTYPHDDVRLQAADATRFHIANLLPTASSAESSRFMQTLAGLVPADRLLERDCFRYQTQRDSRPREGRRAVGTRLTSKKVELVHRFRLPSGTWRAAASSPDCLFAAGIHNGELTAVRARWSGKWQQTASGWCPLAAEHQGLSIRLACRWHRGDRLVVHLAPGIPTKTAGLSATDHFEGLVIGPPPITAGLVGLQYSVGDALLVAAVTSPGICSVSAFGVQRGELLSSPAITHEQIRPTHRDNLQPAFYARGSYYYLGVGPTLISQHVGQEATTLHGPIVAITGSHPQAQPRIVVTCEQGGVVLWGESARSPESAFSMDLSCPVVGLSRSGLLAAATSETIEVFRTDDQRLTFVGALAGPGGEPIAVLPTSAPDRFGLVTREGEVLVYEALRG